MAFDWIRFFKSQGVSYVTRGPNTGPGQCSQKIMGVYEIISTTSGSRYIGSSVDVFRRFADHLCSLRKGKHHSRYLQRAWLKYGEDDFTFHIIRVLTKRKQLVKSEQYYIDLHMRVGGCYNCSPKADRPCTTPEVNRAAQLKVADVHRERAKKQWADPDSRQVIFEAIVKAAATRKGKPNPKLSEVLAKLWKEHPELWNNFVEASKKLRADPVRCKEYGKKIKAKWDDPVWREYGLEVRRKQWTPELCLVQSQIIKALWEDPAHRAKMEARERTHADVEVCRAAALKQHQDPKYGRQSSRRLKRQWQDPEWRVYIIRRQIEGRAAKAAALANGV